MPVSGAMFFDKDVILLLLFACCSYDVIFVALDANAAKVAKRSFYKFDLYISSFIVNPMTHRIREQTNNQTISRRKHNIVTLTITRIID